MLKIFLIAFYLFMTATASATDAASSQTVIDINHILRGQFTQEHVSYAGNAPFSSSGHFVVSPGHGLIWGTEKPVATTTIITPRSAAQDFGGLAIKLPIRNLEHLYGIISSALAGDWSRVEEDFIIGRSNDAHGWHILLTPRPGNGVKLGYTTITVSGHKFIENMIMAKADGSYDGLTFSDMTLEAASLSKMERLLFKEVKP
jgi:hypothetical protein